MTAPVARITHVYKHDLRSSGGPQASSRVDVGEFDGANYQEEVGNEVSGQYVTWITCMV